MVTVIVPMADHWVSNTLTVVGILAAVAFSVWLAWFGWSRFLPVAAALLESLGAFGGTVSPAHLASLATAAEANIGCG